MKVLFIGDVYGDSGIDYLLLELENLKEKYRPNIIILNGENLANGRGITRKIYKQLMDHKINAITGGNWIFANKEIEEFIDDANIVRPCNYVSAPGRGYIKINFNGKILLLINVLGRVYMTNILENPFYCVKKILDTETYDYSIVDFHAEATSEKVALGHYLDGIASAVVGTHTHIQTADERLLPNGTLYISDIGMTGPQDGIIGVEKEIVIQRFLGTNPRPNKVALGKRQINAVFMDLDKKTIERINYYEK